jgi:hypothetical protein
MISTLDEFSRLRAYFSSDGIKLQSSSVNKRWETSEKKCGCTMRFRNLLKKGIFLKKQHAGRSGEGPLGPVFQAISETREVDPANSDQSSESISLVGIDLTGIVSKFDFWVLFANTEGSGVAPWKRLIILDTGYQGEGQVASPLKIGLVAHELTHLVQREFNQSHYWPGGGLNPVRGRRWIGDSTNYMEVLAYLVGWTVEYDLTLAQQFDANISQEQRARNESLLATIRERLAGFTGVTPRRTSRMICDLFPDNPIYKQNYYTELRYRDQRIPPGTWHSWLRQMGFSRSAVDHIMVLAAQGERSGVESTN